MKFRCNLFTPLLLVGSTLAAMAQSPHGNVVPPPKLRKPILDVFVDLNAVHKWNDSNGDTWDPCWTDDDNLYASNNDGRGFGTQSRNIAFHRLSGSAIEQLVGKCVNPMDEYGASSQKEADGATWKSMGHECVDSTFYIFVSRHTYGNESKDPLMRQTAVNASLIKSSDHGRTWTRAAAENYKHPMWPGSRFGAAYFVHYGQNGGRVARDAADRYVYAISNNGFWNGGDNYIVGRVERKKLPHLNAADWTYYAGGAGDDATWTARLDLADPVLNLPGQCGSAPACYVPALDTYIMAVWYLPVKLTKWYEPGEMKYDFYQADHPWGPWHFVSSLSDKRITGGHMYGPTIGAKFQQSDPLGAKVWMFTSGCPFDDKPSSLYKAWAIPLVLRTAALPPSVLVNDDDPAIRYAGEWLHSTGRHFGDIGDNVHSTLAAGASAELTFTGTGIELISEKNVDHGLMDVFLDDQLRQTVDISVRNFPRLAQVVIFRNYHLAAGQHTIKVVNRGPDYGIIDAFRVYGSVEQAK